MALVTPYLAGPPEVPVALSGPAPVCSDRGRRAIAIALATAVATMPILIPSGPGNTAPTDLPIAAGCILILLWLRRSRVRVQVPYLLPVTLSMLAGLVATYLAGAQDAALTVMQDAFCLLWAMAIANVVRLDAGLLRVVVGTWVRTGILWAGVLCFGRLTGLTWLAGMTATDGTRAALTFHDPNLAGNYFVCCFALLLATAVVRRRWARNAGGALILLAIVYTGSNGAAIGLVIVIVVGLLGMLRRRVGTVAMIGALALGGAGTIMLAPHVDLTQIQQQAADSVPVLHDSVGRVDESSGTREVLIKETFDLYLHGDLAGVGPSRTKDTLAAQAAPYVKEAHDDYTAAIVERGVGGAVALVLLIWVVGIRFSRSVTRPLRPDIRAVVPRPEYLLALVLVFAAAGFFYEVLHFRHLWALLGLGAGIDPAVTRPAATPAEAPW